MVVLQGNLREIWRRTLLSLVGLQIAFEIVDSQMLLESVHSRNLQIFEVLLSHKMSFRKTRKII